MSFIPDILYFMRPVDPQVDIDLSGQNRPIHNFWKGRQIKIRSVVCLATTYRFILDMTT